MPRGHAAAPRQGRRRRYEQRRPDQAGLTFPAGLPATCDRVHCPAAGRSRFAADLLTILSRGRTAQNYGATVISAWNAQTQYLGAFIRNRRKLAACHCVSLPR